MSKSLIVLILLFLTGSISVSFGQDRDRFEVRLDKTVVNLWCPASRSPNVECPLGGDRVNIHVECRSEADVSLRYRVSGGRIIGSGKDVVWDLANLRPGIYELMVKAKEGNRSLPTITKAIKLEECPECDLGCTCPTLTVVPSKSGVVAGDTVIFTANVSGAGQRQITYKWTVENGKIIKGCKTDKITVQTFQSASGKTVSASVEIAGMDMNCNCVTSASASVDTSVSTELSLDKKIVYIPCRPGFSMKYYDCPVGRTVNIKTNVNGLSDRKLNYIYSVSGGQIIGSGPKIIWNVSTAQPGTYRITARVYDGMTEVGSPASTVIKVEECPSCNDECLSCPVLSVTSSKTNIVAGEFVYFEALVEGLDNVGYKWNVSGGQIVDGQGTSRIRVKSSKSTITNAVIGEVHLIFGKGPCEDFCLETSAAAAVSVVPVNPN